MGQKNRIMKALRRQARAQLRADSVEVGEALASMRFRIRLQAAWRVFVGRNPYTGKVPTE